jgi:hypothetical protein
MLGQFVLPNNKQVQCVIRICLMTYQNFRYMCLLINDSTCGFVNGGTSPHFLHVVGQRLNHTVGGQRIGRKDPLNWPARSTDRKSIVTEDTLENIGVVRADR